MNFWSGICFGKIDTGFYAMVAGRWVLFADEWEPVLKAWRSQSMSMGPAYMRYRRKYGDKDAGQTN